MAGTDKRKELFTASEVARFCQVDLKTIHNWADRGEIRHFRTPGRHLRFRQVDVLDFLRKYGYPVPESLMHGKPRVHVIDEDENSLVSLQRALSKRFEITAFSEPVDALIAIGKETPDALVIDLASPQLDGIRFVTRLKSADSTRHVRVIVYTSDESGREQALKAGASAVIARPNVNKVLETLEVLMGLDR
jgi:excisionase family DNA binding protein